MQRWGHYWSFTTLSAQRLFETVFRRQYISVEAYGNVLAAVGFLHGLATHEIGARALDQTDQDYQLIISIRATTE